MPQSVYSGGNVTSHPIWVPIYFSNEPSATVTKFNSFLTTLSTDAYWKIMSEYGVSTASVSSSVTFPAISGTLTSASVVRLLTSALESSDPRFATPTLDTVYIFFLPDGVTLNDSDGVSCKAYGAYHTATTLASGQSIAYAMIPRCDTSLRFEYYSLTHELIEAASDPLTNGLAHQYIDDDHYAWALGGGSSTEVGQTEIGDLCDSFTGNTSYLSPTLGQAVQRIWSNASISAGHDPCLPRDASKGPFFFAAPSLPEKVHFSSSLTDVNWTKGILIPVGSTRTIDVFLYSDGVVPDWSVTPRELNGSGNLAFVQNRLQGNNGTVIQIQITVLGQNPIYGAELFAIRSQNSAGVWNDFYGIVGNR